jgi:exodeoxyribonuclease V gamma subunit
MDAPGWLRLTGMLPPGYVGEQAWEGERDRVNALLETVAESGHAAHALFARPLPESQPVTIDRRIAGRHVQGELRGIYDTDEARWALDVRPGKMETDLGFRERIALFLRWALLRLDAAPSRAIRVALVAGTGSRKHESDPWTRRINDWGAEFLAADAAAQAQRLADLERRVAGLLDFFRDAQRRPPWYFPKTSWKALDGDPAAVSHVWIGGDHHVGERDYAPGYARLLAGERDFTAAADHAELHRQALRLREWIGLGPASAEDTA